MSIFKNEITIESKAVLEPYLFSYEYRTSGLSFSSLYMWRDQNEFSWEIIGDYMVIAGLSHLEIDKHEYFLFPPLTKTGTYEPESLRKTLEETRRRFKEKDSTFTIRLLPAHMREVIAEACPGTEFIPDRPNYDYLYLKQDLIDLKGRTYHAKKNHLNYFLNNYQYEYVPLTPDMLDTVMVFLEEFNARKNIAPHEMNWLLMETNAMRDVVMNLNKLDYIAGAIVIDGKVEAFSIGGRLGEETVTVHVEKANSQIRGLYPAINNEFCKHLDDSVVYVNREEDMGIENLRKAKLSYKPVELVEKYIVCFKDWV
ncbi:DUF2156 domain-containing protein [Aminipila butyrica]|uniref:DUF2156 domain-containing protein n=1 Tax=Aminipila butyrica TaxID=433296 RepID=A0A858BXD5_9FIRM|nr:phosphatidylglycerol lysyltransferase domain-containing protein [Aminipila butyrica]QIB70613.1 DUF2156 domain-containing protein [Aminipila butyrica]